MPKRAFIIHGWGGSPEEGWLPWLAAELEKNGFTVQVPAMPAPEAPTIASWVTHLATAVGTPDAETFFVGHSIGCQAIMRYLETLPADAKLGGVTFVAGWFTLTGLESDEERGIARPWLETPIAFEKVRQHTDNFFALFSDNDRFVPLTDEALFAQRLGAKTAVEHEKGHYSGSDGAVEVPRVVEEILAMAK